MADLTVHDTDTAPDTSAPVSPASPAPSASRRRGPARHASSPGGLVATIASASLGSPRVRSRCPWPHAGQHPGSTPAGRAHPVPRLGRSAQRRRLASGARPDDRAYATLTDAAGTPLGRFYAPSAAIDDLDDLETMARETHTSSSATPHSSGLASPPSTTTSRTRSPSSVEPAATSAPGASTWPCSTTPTSAAMAPPPTR